MAILKPFLDPEFLPAASWNRSFLASSSPGPEVTVCIERCGDTVATRTLNLPSDSSKKQRVLYLERLAKFLLWQNGGDKVSLEGDDTLAKKLSASFSKSGDRAFDSDFFGRLYEGSPQTGPRGIGGHWSGCRIGFDLGASDRKVAAVIDGRVVHAEEVRWDPAGFTDPAQHFAAIQQSLETAAAKLPRVDAIGGSSAGIFAGSELRVSTLFKGVPEKFREKSRSLFKDISKAWKGIPFAVTNDGAVAALAGALALGKAPVLGLSMGSSLATGYVDSLGRLHDSIDELAFAPIDYGPKAALDDWSGDTGTGAKYLSQQVLERLLPRAGIPLDPRPLPDQLLRLQELMKESDERAQRVYETIGAYLGYAIAHYSDFYETPTVLVLGRVMTGTGGEVILAEARRVLSSVFPDLGEKIKLTSLDESGKRFGQAVAAASLPPAESLRPEDWNAK